MVDNILKAINLLSYEVKANEKVLVRIEVLNTLRKEIYKLRKENEVLVNKNTQLYSQVKDLTGKLISATTFYPELDIKG